MTITSLISNDKRWIALTIVLMPLVALSICSQENSSFIHTRTYISESGDEWKDHYDYDNGLGYVSMQVDKGASSLHNDLVKLSEYNQFGRLSKKWLPVPMSFEESTDAVKSIQNTAREMYGDQFPYEEYLYECSPTQRESTVSLPGTAWKESDKASRYRYGVDTSDEDYKCMRLSYYVGNLILDGYDKQSYTFKECIDEDGHRTIDFFDKDNLKVVSRKFLDSGKLTTYYVYDDAGNLSFVVPPTLSDYIEQNYISKKGINLNDPVVDKYLYVNVYDDYNRCISRKMPGCAPVYYIYDYAGRCIFTQTGEQREKHEWTFSVPDDLGREVLRGTCKNNLDYAHSLIENVVVRAVLGQQALGEFFGYSIKGVDLVGVDLHLVKFYDDYRFLANSLFHTPQVSQTVIRKPKGLLTGYARCYVDEQDEKSMLGNTFFYDDLGQIVSMVSANAKGGHDFVTTSYDFVGNVTRMQHEHVALNAKPLKEVYSLEYDHDGRIVKEVYKLDENPEIVLAKNTYDEMGRIAIKQQGGGVLTTQYGYNIQSWIEKIKTNGYFEEDIHYDKMGAIGKSCYNGNIAGIDWNAGDKKRAYAFYYDEVDRLTLAAYRENEKRSFHYDTSYTYDKMGNMLTLKRNGLQDGGTYGAIDDLSLIYDGNQLQAVRDKVEDPTYMGCFNFVDGANAETEYEYDQNGNLVKDLNKKISKIEYNSLNLPTKVIFEDGKVAMYTYDACGVRQKAKYTTASPVSSHTIEYCGNMIYEDGILKRILVDGGYVTFNGSTPVYHYFVKDHLGSNRVVVTDKGLVEQVNHYYPFGGLMAESTSQEAQHYKFNGKEYEPIHGLNWHAYGARNYDAAIGRWFCVDGLAGQNASVSPYSYCYDNPIKYVDLWGLDTIPVNDMTIEKWNDFNTDIDVIKLDQVTVSMHSNNNVASTVMSSVGAYTGIKENLFNFAINLDNPKGNLTKSQQRIKTLGIAGAKYYTLNRFLGVSATIGCIGLSIHDMYTYDGKNAWVYVKDMSDIAFSLISCTTPLGFIIGNSYFIATTILESQGYLKIER